MVDAGARSLHALPVHSEVLDQLFGTYLRQPVKVSWEGSAADLLRGSFDDVRVELGGLATAWLPLEGVVLYAARVEIRPGLPARLRVEEPRLHAIVGQRDVDTWLGRSQLPFRLSLGERGILAEAKVAGLQVGEVEASLEVVRGWFILQPRRASLLGIPNYAAWLFRTYLPLPPLANGASLEEIGHEPGRLRLAFRVDSFEEALGPGLLARLRSRILP
jgi:hypothetical protein